MAVEIPEPNLAPPTQNIVYDITPEASEFVIQPTPEEIAAYEQIAGPPAFNPIAELTAAELAELAVKDKSFDIPSAFRASSDLHGDPATVQKAADALNIIKQRGFELSDLPSLPEAGTAVLHTAKGFGKQLWNYANAAGGIVQTAIADVVGAEGFSEASANETTRRLAANIAGTEEAMTGLAQMGVQGVGKIGRALGITKSHAEKTDAERVADLWSDVGRSEVQQQRLAGKGAFSMAVSRGESAKANLDPEEVGELAAGDPFSFYLFGAAGKLGAAVVPLRARAAIAAGTEVAGRVTQVAGGKVIQGVGKAVGGTASLVEKAAPVVSPIVGAVKGGALYGPPGVAGGFIAGERAGKILAGGARRVGGVADDLADLGKQIASSEPVKSAYAQAGRDFLQALPGATFETAKGVGMDLGLAAATSETPVETQGAIGFGTALSMAQGGLRIGGRVVSGQLIAPREYGIGTPQPSSGNFTAFDTIHNEAFQTASPGVKARLNALRKFATGAAGTDVFFAPDATRLAEALQASGLSAEQANAFSQHQGFFSAEMPDKTGTPRKIVIVTNPDAAPHESFHAIQDVLGEQGNQQIDQIVRESYGKQWDNQGTDYANRMTGGEMGNRTWQEAILDTTGKGMTEAKEKIFQQIYNSIEAQTGGAPSRALVESLAKEAYGRIMDEAVAKNPRVPPDQIALQAWREILSPEEAARAADTYMARELAAENFDALFKHAGPSLAEPTSLPAKLARVVGRVMTALGIDTTGGRVSELGDVALRTPVIEVVRSVGQGRLPKIEVPSRGERTTPIGKVPTSEAERAKDIANEAPTTPTERGTMSQREMLGSVAESIAAREGVKINYLSAPDEPAAATTSNRQARRDIIEAFRDMPAAARVLWEKTFFPERVRKTQGGKYQVFGWAPEVFAANAHKMASFLTSHPELSPYAIDATTKSFTPEAWQELYRDTQTFVQNQKAGQTGSGEPLVVPKSMTDRGFTAPASRAGDATPLDQNKADFINLLFNAKLPETPRIQKGKTPLNLAGQEVSEATIPGRVEVPVRPRGEYAGAEAERQGIAGREIAEVNPLRNRIEAAALADKKPMPSLIEANQMLNLENIKELVRAPEQPEFRANTLTLQAGFEPRAVSELTKDLPKVPGGYVRLFHGEGGPQGGGTGGAFFTTTPEKAATYGPKISYVDISEVAAKSAREEAQKIGEGGDTSILTRADIMRSKEVGGDATPVTHNLDASFSPKEAMDRLKNLPDAEWQAEMNAFKGKYGGNLTGWAYEIGSQAKTADDLQAFRSTNEAMAIATTAAIHAGDYEKAMNFSVRSQAAHEAYQAATGETFDGKVAGTAKFIRERYDPTFEYPMPTTASASFSPALRSAEKEYARAAVALHEFLRGPNAVIDSPVRHAESMAEAIRTRDAMAALRDAPAPPSSWTVETYTSNAGQRNIRVVDENRETVEIRSGFRGTDAQALADAMSNREEREAYRNSSPGTTPRPPVVSPAFETKVPSEEKMELRSGQKLLFPEKRLPVWSRVVELWKELGKDEELAKYGTSKSADPNVIARELSIPEETIRVEETSGHGDVEYKSLYFGRERDGNVIDDPDYVQEQANESFDNTRAEFIEKDLERLVELRKYHDAKGDLVHEERLDKAASAEALKQAEREYNEDPPMEWTSDIGNYVIHYAGNGGEYSIQGMSSRGSNRRPATYSDFDSARDAAGEHALDRGLLDPENSESGTGSIKFRNDNGSIIITDTEGNPYIDATGSRKGGGGAGLYKAAFTWALNAGITIGVGSLTAVNAKRRTSNMLSFALQTGDTNFTKPGYAQHVPWTVRAHELNIENLLRAEMRYVFAEAPKLKTLKFDTTRGMFVDDAGKKYDATTIDDKLKAILEPYRSAAGSDFATGVATAKRAILTSSFLRTLDANTVASELSALKAGGETGGTSGLLGEVLYAPRAGTAAPVVESRNLPILVAPQDEDKITIEPRK